MAPFGASAIIILMTETIAHVPLIDWLALVWLIICWAGYGWYSEHSAAAKRGLVGISHVYREQWARAMLAREQRVSDAALIGNLMSTVSFYANTTIYIIAGLFALLGTLDKVMLVAADFPFARGASANVVELKLLVLLGIFIVAYFKFTWALRQFNLLTILVGAAPMPGTQDTETFAKRLAAVNSYAGDEFNRGIRAYYFGIATVTWMIQPWLFVAMTTGILVVLYRRDFASSVRNAFID